MHMTGHCSWLQDMSSYHQQEVLLPTASTAATAAKMDAYHKKRAGLEKGSLN
jgi:hypothetical protein